MMTERSRTRAAEVRVDGIPAGTLREKSDGTFTFCYRRDYAGAPVSLTLPITTEPYTFTRFPPFFDGLLPEGVQLDAMLRQLKIDRADLFSQLVAVGADVVGNVTIFAESDR